MFENSSDAIAITNPDGIVTDANQAWLNLFGYSKKEIATIDVNNLYTSPEERRTFIQQIEKNGFLKNLEAKRRKKDGTIFSCLASASPFRDENGKIFAYQAMIIDITERKIAEEASRNLAKYPLENPNPILRLSKDGVILNANPADKILLQSWGSKLAVKLREVLAWNLAVDVSSSGLSKNTDVELDERMYLISAVPIRDSVYVNLYGRDVTERKKKKKRFLVWLPLLNRLMTRLLVEVSIRLFPV